MSKHYDYNFHKNRTSFLLSMEQHEDRLWLKGKAINVAASARLITGSDYLRSFLFLMHKLNFHYCSEIMHFQGVKSRLVSEDT